MPTAANSGGKSPTNTPKEYTSVSMTLPSSKTTATARAKPTMNPPNQYIFKALVEPGAYFAKLKTSNHSNHNAHDNK